MQEKTFYSRLFKRQIEPGNPDYWTIVLAETLFRIKYLELRDCSCMKCKADLEKLNDFMKSFKPYSIILKKKKPE